MGFVRITGKPSTAGMTKAEVDALEQADAAAWEKAQTDAEALRKARLASLNTLNAEELGRMANELGINPADCKDQADVMKKVRAALKKG